ncbi:MAG: response regulator, partial [Endomicrobiales bacterium]
MDKKLRIIIIEDNQADAMLIEEQLAKEGFSCEYKRVDKESDFRKELEAFKPDIILSDYELPQFNGKEALHIALEKYPFIPFIIVSGFLKDEAAVELLKAGAADYLLKQNTSRLGSAISNALSLKKSKEEKAHAEDELKISNQKLEQRVQERTTELSKANESLRTHQNELEMQNEELVRTKADLESVKDKYLDLYDFAPIGYFTLAQDGTIIRVNLTGSQLVGMERAKVLLRRFQLFVSPDDRETFSTYLKNAFLGLCPQKADIKLIRDNGNAFFGQLECVIAHENDSDVCRIMVIDISERKKADEVLKRDRETLEKLVNEKTETLLNTHRELDRARRLADIGRLSSTIAHELRNPLAAIQLAMHNVQRKAQNPNLDKHLKTVSKKIIESDQIIQNLLSFTRIKSIKIEKFDICELISDCIDTVSVKYVNWDVHLKKDLDCKEGDFIEADFTQFKMLISNILDNAYQALKNKTGTIT